MNSKWLEEDGEPSSQAFYPWRDVDDGCLSLDQRALTSEEHSFMRFTSLPPEGFGQPSAGVWGLTADEFFVDGVSVWSDPVEPLENKPSNPAHALAEFGGKPKNSWKAIGRKLKLKARARGK